MINFPDYEPTELDELWVLNVIALVQNEGSVVYPATGLIYKVRKDLRVFELMNPEILEERIDSAETHWRTGIVLEKMGWKVVP